MITGREALAELILDRLRIEFEGNRLYAWEALRFARLNKVPAPEWVLVYLDGCANALLDEQEPSKALGLVDGKRGPGKQREYTDRQRNLDIYSRIEFLKTVREPLDLSLTEYEAMSRAAQACGMKIYTLKEARALLSKPPRTLQEIFKVVGDENDLAPDTIKKIYQAHRPR